MSSSPLRAWSCSCRPWGGRFGYPSRSPYATTKRGLIAFAETLALELGGDGIRTNVIAPGAVEGDRIRRVLQGRAEASGRSLEEVSADALGVQAIKRFVDPADIAALAGVPGLRPGQVDLRADRPHRRRLPDGGVTSTSLTKLVGRGPQRSAPVADLPRSSTTAESSAVIHVSSAWANRRLPAVRAPGFGAGQRRDAVTLTRACRRGTEPEERRPPQKTAGPGSTTSPLPARRTGSTGGWDGRSSCGGVSHVELLALDGDALARIA
ncbi:SDR family oxidoreductase [Acidiferrimicrobium sp. IK]|nr:SDR family oxidoreductase [Acidiferrimicrobium sp. IK]